MNESDFRCFICQCRSSTASVDRDNPSYACRDNLLSQHLYIIFLLRKVLQIPSEKLAQFLQKCPDLENWIRICPDCDVTVSHCKRLHEQILDIQKRFINTQRTVIDTMNESQKRDKVTQREEQDKELGKVQQARENFIGDECRRIVAAGEYKEWKNPFIKGDLAAQRHCQEKRDRITAITEELMDEKLTVLPLAHVELKEDGDVTPTTDEIVDVVLEMGESTWDMDQNDTGVEDDDIVELENFPASGIEEHDVREGPSSGEPRDGNEDSEDDIMIIDNCDDNSDVSDFSFLDFAIRNNSIDVIGIEELEELAKSLDINDDDFRLEETDNNFLPEVTTSVIGIIPVPDIFPCPFCKEGLPLIGNFEQFNTMDICLHLDQCYKTCQQKNVTIVEKVDLNCSLCCRFTGSVHDIPLFVNHLLFCFHHSHQGPVPAEGVLYQQRVFQCHTGRGTGKKNIFFNFDTFLKHLDRLKKMKYECTNCGEPLQSTDHSFEHWRNHHKSLLESISVCNLSSCYRKLGPSQWKNLLPEVPWWCPYCGAQFQFEKQRNDHVIRAHSEKGGLPGKDEGVVGSCTECNRKYSILEELQVHCITTHNSIEGDRES